RGPASSRGTPARSGGVTRRERLVYQIRARAGELRVRDRRLGRRFRNSLRGAPAAAALGVCRFLRQFRGSAGNFHAENGPHRLTTAIGNGPAHRLEKSLHKGEADTFGRLVCGRTVRDSAEALK